MSEILFICVMGLLVVAVILELLQFRRNATVDLPHIQQSFETIEKSHQLLDRSLKDEIARGREETRLSLAEQRHGLQTMTDSLNQTFIEMRSGLEKKLDAVQQENASKLDQMRKDFAGQTQAVSQEIAATLTEFNQSQVKSYESLAKSFVETTQTQKAQWDAICAEIETKLKRTQDAAAKQLDQIRTVVDEKLQGSEKRLGDSFQHAVKRLDQISKALSELQSAVASASENKKA